LSRMFRLAGYRVLWKVPGHYGHVHVEQERANAIPLSPPLRQVLGDATTTRPRQLGPPIGG